MTIEFDEATHTYKVDGQVKPSQSEIVRYFFRDEYLPPQHILDYAAEKGTAIHKTIQLYEDDNLGYIPDWLNPYLEQWKLFRKKQDFKPLAWKEAYFYSMTYDFCGTIDIIYQDEIWDVKSGQKYLKHQLQTAMYSLLAEDNGIPISKRGCLYIKEDSFKFQSHEDDNDFDLAKAMIKIFHWAKKNKLIKNGN